MSKTGANFSSVIITRVHFILYGYFSRLRPYSREQESGYYVQQHCVFLRTKRASSWARQRTGVHLKCSVNHAVPQLGCPRPYGGDALTYESCARGIQTFVSDSTWLYFCHSFSQYLLDVLVFPDHIRNSNHPVCKIIARRNSVQVK